jgi:ketosteroid isomerase-like protein
VASEIFSPKTLGEALRLLQDRAGMNRGQLARACRVSPASITNYLTGSTTPQAGVLRRISNALADRLSIDPVHLWVELGVLVDASPPSRVARRPSKSAEALHHRIGEALSTGDVDGILALCADDITIHVPGRNPFSGEFRGKAGVKAILGLMAELSTGDTKFEAELISATNEHTVHIHRTRLHVGAELLDMRSLVVCYIREGVISEVWIYPEDQYLVDDFWASLDLTSVRR